MQKFGLYVLTPIFSFFGGFSVYVWILHNYWNQELGNDAASVLINGGLAYIVLAVPLYFLIIRFIDKRFNRFKSLLYPLLCMVLFFLPTSLILLAWGGRNLVSAEAMLFHGFFLTSGLIFGILTWGFKNASGSGYKKDKRIN